MKKLLITGFDPFGGATVNPSWQAVSRLPDRVGEFELCKLEIPTVYDLATRVVLEKAAEFNPDVILCVGQAGGRDSITPERIGVNIREARISDNAGNQPRGEFVAPDGPAAYFSTVPVEKMVQAIEAEGIKATVSNSAGAFVCNDTLYGILHHFAGTRVRCGFIHVPYIPQQGNPSMELEQIVSGLAAAIAAC